MIKGIYLINSKHPVLLKNLKNKTQVKGDGVVSVRYRNPNPPLSASQPVGVPTLSASPIVHTGNGLDSIQFKPMKKKKISFVLK